METISKTQAHILNYELVIITDDSQAKEHIPIEDRRLLAKVIMFDNKMVHDEDTIVFETPYMDYHVIEPLAHFLHKGLVAEQNEFEASLDIK